MNFRLERDAFGRIALIDAQGVRHEGIVPVRAFPLTGPDGGLSLVGLYCSALAVISLVALLWLGRAKKA